MRPAALLALLVVSCAGSTPSPKPVGPPPNILFVLIDDMGWPDLGCYGHRFHETPRLDRLASEGVRFTNFYAAPVCSPTRGTIESGQNSARTGITDFLPGHWRPFEKLVVPPMPSHLDHSLTTPGEALGKAGYVTGYFGKWHLGGGAAHAPDTHGYQVTASKLGPEFQEWRGKKAEGPKQIDLLTDQATWFLEQHAGGHRPFFLHVSHHAVHIPIQGEEASIAKYVKKPKPKEGVNHPVYAAMVGDLDRSIGQLLDTLESRDLAKNTIVVVASDNGGLREIFTANGQVVSTNAPLRDEKGTLYEGGIRVPFMVRWPGVAPKGKVCREPAATWDLLPTFCAMAGIDTPAQPIDGIDLTPIIRRPGESLGRKSLHFHYPHYHHSRPAGAIRRGKWKLIEWFEDGSAELYDLEADPGETRNLAADHTDLVKELLGNLARWRKKTGARMPTQNPKHDPARAGEWWNRKSKKPLDLEVMGDRFEQRASKPYFRTK